MKKVLLNLILLLSVFAFATNVNASGFEANIIGDDTFNESITLYLQVDNMVDFSGACKGLCGLVGNLNYDSNKIELSSVKALKHFDLTQGASLVLYKNTGVANKSNIMEMKFKNKSLIKDETTKITLTNIVATDGDKDISTDDASKTIKFVNKTITNEKNIISSKNKSTNTSKKSNNNYLSSISLSSGDIKFSKEILTYNIEVDYEISSLDIKAESENNKATITGIGNHSLNVGKNVFKIVVKAEDKSSRVYTLNVTRKEKDSSTNSDILNNKKTANDNNRTVIIVVLSIIVIAGITSIVIWKKKKETSM